MPYLVYKSTITGRIVPEVHHTIQATSAKSEHGGGFKGRIFQVTEITAAEAMNSLDQLQQKYPYKG